MPSLSSVPLLHVQLSPFPYTPSLPAPLSLFISPSCCLSVCLRFRVELFAFLCRGDFPARVVGDFIKMTLPVARLPQLSLLGSVKWATTAFTLYATHLVCHKTLLLLRGSLVSFAVVAALLGWLSPILGWGPSFNDFVSVTSNLMKFVSLRFVLLSVWLGSGYGYGFWALFLFRFWVFALSANFSAYKICEKRHSNDLGVVALHSPCSSCCCCYCCLSVWLSSLCLLVIGSLGAPCALHCRRGVFELGLRNILFAF